jgi:Fur family ferric uptake transcriptional regulator
MNSGMRNVDELLEMFARYLMENKLRKTAERQAILTAICHIHGHFDVEMLWKQLEAANFYVSRASIYNTLELLMNARLIVRHQFSTQLVQYELKGVASAHHHVVCYYCGSVREVKSDKVKIMADYRIPKFTQEFHSLYIYGMCSKCKFRLMKEQKKKTNKN